MNMRLVQTRQTRLQEVWFFHNDQWSGDNAVHLKVPVRVFVARDVREVSSKTTKR